MSAPIKAVRVWLSISLALALCLPSFVPASALAASTFTGGPDNDPPIFVPNDHTPVAIHYSATGLQASTTYRVKVRFTEGTSPSGATNRGFTWNPQTAAWAQEREDWSLFPTVTTDASGTVTSNAGWVYTKFGDEAKSGNYYILISLNLDGASGTSNCTSPTPVGVLDMKTQGSWWHNGTATGTQADKRAEVTSFDTTTTVYSLAKTEANLVDDDSNGIVDDEQYGPAGATGDWRMGVPASTTVDVFLNRAKKFNDFVTPQPDTEVSLGAADQSAPTSPAALVATPTNRKVSLAWDAASDDTAVTGYRIYRWQADTGATQSTPVHKLIGTSASPSFIDTDTALATNAWSYEVRAFDAAGNISARSDSQTVTAVLTTPSAVASVSPSANAAGWFKSTPLVELIPQNADSVEYSWDTTTGPWTTLAAPITTAEGIHTLYYRGVDEYGTGDTVPLELKVDTTAPASVKVISPSFASNSSTSEKFSVSWSATDTNPLTYDVKFREAPSGSWKTWKRATIETSGIFTGGAGRMYEFQATATDVAGNKTSSASAFSSVPYDDRSAKFSSGWFTSSYSGFWKGSAHATSRAGVSATFSFSGGTTLYTLLSAGPKRGKVAVYVDGHKIKTVDTYAARSDASRAYYLKGLGGRAVKHTVKLVSLGTKGRARIDFDGVIVKR